MNLCSSNTSTSNNNISETSVWKTKERKRMPGKINYQKQKARGILTCDYNVITHHIIVIIIIICNVIWEFWKRHRKEKPPQWSSLLSCGAYSRAEKETDACDCRRYNLKVRNKQIPTTRNLNASLMNGIVADVKCNSAHALCVAHDETNSLLKYLCNNS